MTLNISREEFSAEIKKQYSVVRMLSDKNETRVLLLKHKELNQKVVLKIFEKQNEIYNFLKGISFENLPRIFDTYELTDGFAVLEEYIDGVTVAEVIESGAYSYKGAKKVIADICDALLLLHENGFVHRDIKPENVMISKDKTVKLIDFNVSRRVKLDVRRDTAVLGTLGYAPPEQIGISQSGPATDIYAVGVLLNVMLTGAHPSEELAKGKAGKIVLRCTQISPDKRFENVKKLKQIL